VEIVDRAEPGAADAIVDAAGAGAAEALRPGGRFVVVVPGSEPGGLPDGATQRVVRVLESGARLGELLGLAERGAIRPGAPKTYRLEDAHAAFAAFERRTGPRVVLVHDGLTAKTPWTRKKR
jgi:threonine dehydrogenase-like Zn-dependent dehydrogenase